MLAAPQPGERLSAAATAGQSGTSANEMIQRANRRPPRAGLASRSIIVTAVEFHSPMQYAAQNRFCGGTMLTKADDYPIHQTADPIAFVGTSDRNFYDRYFFNGYSRDGATYFAAALGTYPNRRVTDAARSVIHRGRQYVVRACGLLGLGPMDTHV